MAASRTVRHIGPAVSWLCAMGMIPARLIKPIVALMPTSACAADGDVTDPSVSVPIAIVEKLAAHPAPEPELEPDGVRSSAYGLCVWPPRPLQPLLECVERKFAHSLRFVLPRITAPAARRRAATNESRAATLSASASDPAVVCSRSAVSMLSFMRIGMPCSGPRILPALRSASSWPAIASASGLISITASSAGPF